MVVFISISNYYRELLTGEKRYITGLDQLAIAAKSVAALQEALEVLQPKLAAGAAAVAETTAKVEKEKEGVALVEAEVLVDQAAAEEQVNHNKKNSVIYRNTVVGLSSFHIIEIN